MKTDEMMDIEKKAVIKYGFGAQLRMLQEECGELIVAASHYSRGRENAFENLVEELADVEIMIKQIIIGLGVDYEMERVMEFKLNRLKSRLEKNE